MIFFIKIDYFLNFSYLCIRICGYRGVAQSVQSASVTLKRSSVRARSSLPEEIYLDVAQLVAHLVRDQEVARKQVYGNVPGVRIPHSPLRGSFGICGAILRRFLFIPRCSAAAPRGIPIPLRSIGCLHCFDASHLADVSARRLKPPSLRST